MNFLKEENIKRNSPKLLLALITKILMNTLSRVPDLVGDVVKMEDFKEKLEKLSLLSQEYLRLMDEVKTAYEKTNSPLKYRYITLIDEFSHEVMEKHSPDSKFFMSERVLNDLTEICQSRMTQKILQPGYIWDSQITHNVCQMLTHIPSNELQLDKCFLKTVSRLPPIHPVRAGPGTWFCIHVLAKTVETYEDHMHVCRQIEELMKHFYCPKCKEHFRNYLHKNDPRKLLPNKSSNPMKEVVFHDSVSNGKRILIPKLFIWTVEFHNAVNVHKDDYSGAKTRLKMDILEAWNLYQDYKDGKFIPCLSCTV